MPFKRRSKLTRRSIRQRWDRPVLAFLLILFALSTQADEVEDGPATEVMIVTGSYAPRDSATIPNATTVIEGEAIDRTISTSLDDVLRFVPGLQFTRQGARGGRGELYLRGLDPNHAVVMIDGVRLNDPTNSRGGSFDPTTLSLVDIERVEIVRGPLSAIHGSDALAGAINIVTRKAGPETEPSARVRVRGGRFHAGQAIAQAETGVAGVAGLSLGAALDTFRDPNSDGGFDGASLKAKLASTLPGDIDLEAFTRIHESSARGFPDSSGGSELAVLRSMEDRNVREILVGASARKTFDDVGNLTFRASRASRRESLDSPGIDIVPPLDPSGEFDVPSLRAGDEYERWDLSFLADTTSPEFRIGDITHRTRLTLGTQVIWEDGESDTFALDLFGPTGTYTSLPWHDHRRTIGFFGELEHSINESITLSGSLRYDTIRNENDRWSPAAGLSFEIPDTRLVLFGNFGEGFKLPSFYARRNPIVGDADLLTETSRGWEVGFRAHSASGDFRLQASYFDIRVKEIIDFDASGFALVNRNRLVSRGVEIEIDWEAADCLDIRLGGSWNHTDFEGLNIDPRGRPEWRGFAEFTARPIDDLALNLRVLGVSSIKATAFVTAPRIDTLNGYARIDIGGEWRVTETFSLFAEIQNLTDSTPREAVGFESPGIAPRVGFTLRL